jgi:Predicted membrane protein
MKTKRNTSNITSTAPSSSSSQQGTNNQHHSSSSTSSSRSLHHHAAYTCITCLEPNQLLYRQYSNARNIKLQTCPKCQRDVDPYIERELLLVVMDMILLRPCAYRHLFLNRYRWCHLFCSPAVIGTAENGADTDIKTDTDTAPLHWRAKIVQRVVKRKRLPLILLVLLVALTCLMLKMGLKLYDGNDDDHDKGKEGYLEISSSILYPLVISSFGEMVALWIGTIVTATTIMSFFLVDSSATKNDTSGHCNGIKSNEDSDSLFFFWMQLHFAIFLPQLFHFMTLFVHIYENSYMVRILGKMFVFCFGYMAVGTVMEKRMMKNTCRLSTTSKIGTKDADTKASPPKVQDAKRCMFEQEIDMPIRQELLDSYYYKMHGLPFVVGSLLEIMLCSSSWLRLANAWNWKSVLPS